MKEDVGVSKPKKRGIYVNLRYFPQLRLQYCNLTNTTRFALHSISYVLQFHTNKHKVAKCKFTHRIGEIPNFVSLIS